MTEWGTEALRAQVGPDAPKSLEKRLEPGFGPIRDVLRPCFYLAQEAGVSIMLWKRSGRSRRSLWEISVDLYLFLRMGKFCVRR